VSQPSSGEPRPRTPRDRDDAGRPRNSRPRDDLGRPLPADAAQAVPIPDSPVASPAEAASAGGTLLLEGRPFHAHEVFEDAWKASEGPERDLWRGLAQVAVGLTHARRGNPRGAVWVLRRGAGRLRDYAATITHPGDPSHPVGATPAQAPVPYGIDVTYVASRADDLAARIESDGLDAVAPDAFLLSLRPA
jgi:hypothetical protein